MSTNHSSPLSSDSLRTFLLTWLGEHLEPAPPAIGENVRLRDLGLDSAKATQLVVALSQQLGRTLPLTLIWQHPTVAALAHHLSRPPGESTTKANSGATAATARLAPEDRSIAVVAMACRFPGGADSPAAFWDLLEQGRDVVGPVPPDRFDAEAHYDPDLRARGKAVTKWGGYLTQSDAFDPELFGISPREAAEMDPQQRLMLELAWEAFEEAGLPKPSLRDRSVGVFVGSMWNDYARLRRDETRAIEQFTATGQDDSILSARISYFFGLRGPSLSLNTACSSSLVAVHLACQSLLSGDSELALAGAVNLIFGPNSTVAMSKFGGMAPDGKCKAFDSRANGYVRGEGAALVLLKPLRRALEDGDVIHAVLRGSAVNNDGFSNGLTSPSPEAQAEMLRAAYANAGVSPAEVQYVEAHGTGTMLGDPIEAGALGEVLGMHPDRRAPLRIGSAKTNIGHLEAAAGMAGLFKTIQAMERGKLPASLHFETPNPNIAFAALNLEVQAQLTAWPAAAGEAKMLAGVSSFGFGGTNAHVVVEAAPPAPALAAQLAPAARQPVFAFSGNGSQWAGMARDLFPHAAFRTALRACDRALVAAGGQPVSEALRRGQLDLARVDQLQPALFAVQVSLVALWRSWGVTPAAVVGHSVGEIAAAYVAGALTLEDAARVVVHRSRLQQETADRGGMVLLETTEERAAALLGELALPGLAVAAVNSHTSVVISGALDELPAVIRAAEAQQITARTVRVNVAYHGPQMQPLRERFATALEDLAPITPALPFFSTVTGSPFAAPPERAYWVQNLADPVRFSDAIDALASAGHRDFLEIGPHPTLAAAISAQLRYRTCEAGFVGVSLEREGDGRARLQATRAAWMERAGAASSAAPVEPAPPRAELLVLSAHNEAALRQRLAELAPIAQRAPALDGLAHVLGERRTHLQHRAAAVVSSATELAELAAATPRDVAEPLPAELLRAAHPLDGRPRVAFVFPGQGSQWLGMGRSLLPHEPVFRHQLLSWEPLFLEFSGWSLQEQLFATAETSRLAEVDVVQPMIFAMQTALAALWRSWGVEPEVVIGHSMGEVAAAYTAGILTARDAARIICTRSRIAKQTSGNGGMAVLELSVDDCRRAIAAHADVVSLAACNDPGTCVISGDAAALEQIGRAQKERGVFFRPIKVDYASHSPQMDQIKGELLQALHATAPRPARTTFHSTVEDQPLAGPELDAAYWARNLREPVLFAQRVRAAAASGINVFVEISPHPLLTYSIAKTVPASQALVLASTKRDLDERTSLLASLATLYTAGAELAWEVITPLPPRDAALPALPAYPFQRERCWFSEEPAVSGARTIAGDCAFLDRFVRSPFPSERLLWESDLSLERFPYLVDHRVGGIAVFPGTGYLECVMEAAHQLHGDLAVEIGDLAFERALLLEEGAVRTLQLALEPEGDGHRFSLSSYDAALARSIRHVSGRLRLAPAAILDEEAPRPTERHHVTVADFYGNLERAGNTYGPTFQAVHHLAQSPTEVLGAVVLPEALSLRGMRIHPIVLDACLQVMAAPIAMRASDGARLSAFMPTRAARVTVLRPAGRAVTSHVRLHAGEVDRAGDLYGDIDVRDEQGALLARIERICFHLLEERGAATKAPSELVHRTSWEAAPPPDRAPATSKRRWVLFADDSGVASALAAALRSQGATLISTVTAGAVFTRSGDDFQLRPGSVEDARTLLRSFAEPLHLVHLWNLSLAPSAAALPADLIELGTLSPTLLLRAAAELSLSAAPRLWIATRGVWSDEASLHDAPTGPSQAPAWGLTRAIAQEAPSSWGGIIDLDSDEPVALQAQRLLVEVLAPAGEEDRVRYRGGERLVARLLRDDAAPASSALTLRADRAYLITGGLGALGLRLATWMVGRGARHLILVARTPLPPRRRWSDAQLDAATREKIEAIRGLERLGASVLTPAFDIGDGAALEAFVSEYRSELRPELGGVAHLAGVIRSELLAVTERKSFDEAFRSKVQGAWNLHYTLADAPLDFFLMFSSASAVLDSPLLGAYAAANAFLDGLARFRRARGLPAQALAWGFWAEAGMAARDLKFAGDRGGDAKPDQGMRAFSPAAALEALGELMARNPEQAVILDVDWATWLAAYPDAANSPILRSLRAEHAAAAATPEAAAESAGSELRRLSADDRRAAVETLLLAELAAVLKTRVAKISPTALFGTMGLDSMLSLELRNRLERKTATTLPGTLVWNYPSVQKLATFLSEKIGAEAAAAEPLPDDTSASSLARGSDLQALPSPEILAVLREMGVLEENDPLLADPQALWALVHEAEKYLQA